MDTFVRDQAALGALLAAQLYGQKMRIRFNLDFHPPLTIYGVCDTAQVGQTTLQDYRDTGRTMARIMVPRQPGFEPTGPIQPGLVVEKEFGSGRWWSVDEVEYCCADHDSPVFTFDCSWSAQDPQPTT